MHVNHLVVRPDDSGVGRALVGCHVPCANRCVTVRVDAYVSPRGGPPERASVRSRPYRLVEELLDSGGYPAEHGCGGGEGSGNFHPVIRAVDFEHEWGEPARDPSVPQRIRGSSDEEERSSGGAKPRDHLGIGEERGQPHRGEAAFAHQRGRGTPQRLADDEYRSSRNSGRRLVKDQGGPRCDPLGTLRRLKTSRRFPPRTMHLRAPGLGGRGREQRKRGERAAQPARQHDHGTRRQSFDHSRRLPARRVRRVVYRRPLGDLVRGDAVKFGGQGAPRRFCLAGSAGLRGGHDRTFGQIGTTGDEAVAPPRGFAGRYGLFRRVDRGDEPPGSGRPFRPSGTTPAPGVPLAARPGPGAPPRLDPADRSPLRDPLCGRIPQCSPVPSRRCRVCFRGPAERLGAGRRGAGPT